VDPIFETRMGLIDPYVAVGGPSSPAPLLIPAESESRWDYEKAMGLLEKHFHCFVVGLTGQGRSSRIPSHYTLDNIGNDLVRFIALAIKRTASVSGLSSGGLAPAWLSAYGIPGSIRLRCWRRRRCRCSTLTTSEVLTHNRDP
jgi:hypothetical protein